MARDVYQLVAVGSTGNEFWEFVQHFESGVTNSTDPLGDAQNLVTMWQAVFEDAFLACLPSAVEISGYKSKRVNNTGGPTYMLPGVNLAGSRTGTLATGCVGPCLVSPYSDGAKWASGKLFFPGVAQADITSNHFASALITLINTFAGLLANTHTQGTTWDFVVWSKKLSVAFVPFDIILSLKAGVQRRRLTPVV